MPDADFSNLLKNITTNLDQYKNSILDNIEYNLKTNKIEYKDFNNINIPQILSQLNTDLGKDVVDQFNIESFLRKINQILDFKLIFEIIILEKADGFMAIKIKNARINLMITVKENVIYLEFIMETNCIVR